MKFAVALFAILLCLFPLEACAACSNPTGPEGNVIYDHDHHMLSFCNGTNWIATSGYGGGAISSEVLSGNTGGTAMPAGVTFYCSPVFASCSGTAPGPGAGNTTIFMVTRAGTVRNLYYLAGAANGAGKTNTVTVLKNGVATALTCSVTNATTCSDTTDSFSVVATDYITVQIVTAAGSTSIQHTFSMGLY